MKQALFSIAALLFFVGSASSQTADEIIAKYVKAVGGADKMAAMTTLRRTGKFIGGGGFEAKVVQENKRPNKVREDFIIMGMTGITAYDGSNGWKIQPFGGKKDPEALGEEEMKGIVEDADFDGPFIDYKAKGNTVEYMGMEPVEGTDAYKLKVTLKNGDVFFYYFDTDYYVPIKIDTKRLIRGEEIEYETSIGDYKEVSGVYMPFYNESNLKGSQDKQKTQYDVIEANVAVSDSLFQEPAVASKPAGH